MSNYLSNRFVKSLSITLSAHKVASAVLLAAVSAVAGLGMQQAQAAEASKVTKDCSANSIVECGVTSADDLINKIKADKPGDLKTIYAKFGLAPSEYNEFAKEAKVGTIKTNGEIVVDGKVVMHNAWSLGRNKKSYSKPFKIGNDTYHISYANDVLAGDQPVLVWFDGKGGYASQFIIMSCGNPAYGIPAYRCEQLKSKEVQGKKATYEFSTVAPVSENVKITKVVYDFNDGSEAVTRTALNDTVTHTFKKSGTYKVKATVYAKLSNGKEITLSGDGCIKEITVKVPTAKKVTKEKAAWECTALKATSKSKKEDEHVYTLRADADMANAALVSGDFDFGDGTSQQAVKPASAGDDFISVDHAYKAAGTYRLKATLTFKPTKGTVVEDGVSVSGKAVCEATLTVEQPAKPAAAAPAATPPAVLGKAVTELPATGPAGVAGLFAGSAALGTVGYRWRARRRINKVDDLVDRLRRS